MSWTIAGALRRQAKISWLDLRNSGLSVIERLALEEALLRHDPLQRMWAMVGTHDPTYGKRINITDAASSENKNVGCAIVLGIGGKPHELLDIDEVRKDGVLAVKRFSGGGTVVVDHDSLFTTFIGRTDGMPDVKPYPRELMAWSADEIFGPVFGAMKRDMHDDSIRKRGQRSMVVKGSSCGVESTGIVETTEGDKLVRVPNFSLRENDYILGERKMGGNAQSIVKGGWIHHTSFLYDYSHENMGYLTLPKKRPEYRGDRSHRDFLIKLKDYVDPLGGKKYFFDKVKEATDDAFEMEEVTLQEALKVVDDELGGFQNWFDGKCRSRVITV
mmetsp:Transcript_15545/g.22905  ORF Transcript_15545/g.22905 Transcript_15545/m.22905 type:complete len:330 (-) Transcript_15545:73-1062(-)